MKTLVAVMSLTLALAQVSFAQQTGDKELAESFKNLKDAVNDKDHTDHKCPEGAKCGGAPDKPVPGKPIGKIPAPTLIVVHDGYAYMALDKTQAAAIRTLAGPKTPPVVAVINGVEVKPTSALLKMPYDVISVVDQSGNNSEQPMTKADKNALYELGAKIDSSGQVHGGAWLKFELAGPIDGLKFVTKYPYPGVEGYTRILYF